MARDFKIGTTTPSSIKVGTSAVNLVKFSNEGYVWARPIGTITYTKDENIKSVSVSRLGKCGDSASSSGSSSTNTLSSWARYGDYLTFTATVADTSNTTETQTTTGYQTTSEPVTEYRTISEDISDSRTVKTRPRETRSTSWGISQTSSTTGSTYESGAGSWYIAFNGNGANVGYMDNLYGTTNTRRDGTYTQPTIRYGTHYADQYQDHDHYSYQSNSGTRYYYQKCSGTRYYYQSRTVYQDRTKTRTYAIKEWSGAASGTSASASVYNITANTTVGVTGKYTDTYTDWADYDYGSWSTYKTADDLGQWITYDTKDEWVGWKETGTDDNNYSGWNESSGWDSWGDWQNNGSAYNNNDWGGWYTTGYNAITLPEPVYALYYHQFDYWSMGSTSGAAVSAGETYSSGTTTAYAHWSNRGLVGNSSRVKLSESSDVVDNVYLYLYAGGFEITASYLELWNTSGCITSLMNTTLTTIKAGRSKTFYNWSGDWPGSSMMDTAWARVKISTTSGTTAWIYLPTSF